MPVLAIDLGGTKLATAVVDRQGEILALRKVAVKKNSFAQTVEQIAAESQATVKTAGLSWRDLSGGGLIVPGIANNNGLASAPNLWGNADLPLLRDLSDRVPVPLVIESDRAGYLLGENWLGVSRGLSDVVFVAVGTGIGAGILSNGRLLRGIGGAAGAVGWMALNPHFEERYAAVGCWEAEAAGPAIAHRAGHTSAQSVVAATRIGDSDACRVLQEAAAFIGRGVASLISIFNPQMIVLGGGLMHAGDLLLEHIRREVLVWANPRAAAQVRIELSELGDQAGLLGAARIALNPS